MVEQSRAGRTTVVLLVFGAILGVSVAAVPASWTLALAGAFLVMSVFALALRALPKADRWFAMVIMGWVVYYLSGLAIRGRGTEEIAVSALDPAALARVVLVAVAALIVTSGFLVRKSEGVPGGTDRTLAVRFLAAFAVFDVVSTLWSVYPAWTLYKSLEYGVGVALAVVVARALRSFDEMDRLLDATWTIYGAMLLSVWIGVLVSPGLAITPVRGVIGWQLNGLFPVISANGVGDIAATLFIIALVRLGYRYAAWRRWAVLLAASGITLVLSQARSAILGVAVAVLFMVLAVPRLRKRQVAVILLVAASLYTSLDYLVAYVRRGQSEALLANLSGRVPYWEAALELTSRSPLIGSGAYAAGRFGVLEVMGETRASSLHNTWVEVLVGSGVVGLVLLAVAVVVLLFTLLRFVRTSRDSDRGRLVVEVCAVLMFELTRSAFTSGAIMWHPANRFFLAVVVYMVWTRLSAGPTFDRPRGAPGTPPALPGPTASVVASES